MYTFVSIKNYLIDYIYYHQSINALTAEAQTSSCMETNKKKWFVPQLIIRTLEL
jgi:hypothetical protein